MSEFDALRQLMGDLAGNPPQPLDRQEAVMSRISRRLQCQAAVRGIAAFAVIAVLGVGAVKTTQNLSNTGSEGNTVTPPSPSASPTHRPSHEPTKAPGVEPTTHSTPGATAEPSHAPVAEPTHPTPTEPPAGPPAPENTAAGGPLTVELSMSPAAVDTATDTHALVTARDGDGRLLAVDIIWGDGKTFHFSPGAAACPRTTHLDGTFNHRYAAAGSYVVQVTVTSGDCAAEEKVTREAHVTVTGPQATASPTNGPSAPVADASTRTGDNPANVYLNVSGGDQDGYVRRVAVDWGDGTTPSAGEWPTSSCTNASGSDHPGPTHHDANVSHHYATAGAHTVTVTVTSVACDGSHTQTGTKSISVQSP